MARNWLGSIKLSTCPIRSALGFFCPTSRSILRGWRNCPSMACKLRCRRAKRKKTLPQIAPKGMRGRRRESFRRSTLGPKSKTFSTYRQKRLIMAVFLWPAASLGRTADSRPPRPFPLTAKPPGRCPPIGAPGSPRIGGHGSSCVFLLPAAIDRDQDGVLPERIYIRACRKPGALRPGSR